MGAQTSCFDSCGLSPRATSINSNHTSECHTVGARIIQTISLSFSLQVELRQINSSNIKKNIAFIFYDFISRCPDVFIRMTSF